MSQSGSYQQYGGNPYGQTEAGYDGSNPYGVTGGYGTSNPYGGTNDQELNPPPVLTHGDSNYSQGSQYSQPGATPQQTREPLSQQDFLIGIDGVKRKINELSSNIQQIGSLHQRLLSSPDNNSSAQLEGIVTDTQVRNGRIKDDIKYLEKDAAREPNNSFKKTQVESLKRTFKTQLEQFQKEESDYGKRYREAIARQYRIVNPDATEQEVNEAANADWGDEGIFTQALKTNRSAQANSALGAVRARHNDIQRIEKTLSELALLFQQLNEAVVYDEERVKEVENDTVNVHHDAEQANKQLDTGIQHARRARRLKWWTLLTVIAIICILALVLGLYFGLRNNKNNNNSNNNNNG